MTIFLQKYYLFVLATTLLSAALAPSLPAAELTQTPFSVVPFEDVTEMTEFARELHYEVATEGLPSGTVLTTEAEFDGLYAVDVELLYKTLVDLDSYAEFVPRVTVSNGLPLPLVSPEAPRSWLQELTLSFRVLFFGETYDYILRMDEVDLDRPGEYGVEYALERSIDGKFTDIRGSWFLSDIAVNGERYTYVRYRNKISFAQDSFGLETALRWFGPRDMRANIQAFVEEAERRGAGRSEE